MEIRVLVMLLRLLRVYCDLMSKLIADIVIIIIISFIITSIKLKSLETCAQKRIKTERSIIFKVKGCNGFKMEMQIFKYLNSYTY